MDKKLKKEFAKIRVQQINNIINFFSSDTIFFINIFDIQTGTYYESIWDTSRSKYYSYKYSNGQLQKGLDKNIFYSPYYSIAEQSSNIDIKKLEKQYNKLLGGNIIYCSQLKLKNRQPLQIKCILFEEFFIPENSSR